MQVGPGNREIRWQTDGDADESIARGERTRTQAQERRRQTRDQLLFLAFTDPSDHPRQSADTHTCNPFSPESVYSFNIVLLDPPAPAARVELGLGAVGARRLARSTRLGSKLEVKMG